MRDKFGLTFRIVDSDLMRRLRRERGIHVNPWAHHPRLITSIDYVKRARPLHLFRQAVHRTDGRVLQRWGDLLIVDEAHNVAPAGTANYVQASDRTHAVREMVPHFEHKLFLTATPHNGYQDSFTALLEMLDDQRFARGVMPDKAQVGRVMVRRMKSEIQAWDGTSRFPKRDIRPIEVPWSDAEVGDPICTNPPVGREFRRSQWGRRGARGYEGKGCCRCPGRPSRRPPRREGVESLRRLDEHAPGCTVYVWPEEGRTVTPDSFANLHAKCAVADGRQAFVSSANLTGWAMNHNLELGYLVTGGPTPRSLEAHLDALRDGGAVRIQGA